MSVLYLLISFFNWLPPAVSILCTSGLINELIPITNEYSSCNGTACFITAYAFKYPEYHGLYAYEMGCFTAPYDLPLGCRKDEGGGALCLCSEDYCNEQSLVANSSGAVSIPTVTCPILDKTYPDDPHNGEICRSVLCSTMFNTYMNRMNCAGPYDSNVFFVLGLFDLFYVGFQGFIWPAQSCLRMDGDLFYQGETEYCTYSYPYNTTYSMTPIKKQTICRYSPSDTSVTCVGNLCFTAENAEGKIAMGCIQQTNPKGLKLAPGFYDFYNSRLFVCNGTMCNGNYDAYGNRKQDWVPSENEEEKPTNESCCPRREKKKNVSGVFLSPICLFAILVFCSTGLYSLT